MHFPLASHTWTKNYFHCIFLHIKMRKDKDKLFQDERELQVSSVMLSPIRKWKEWNSIPDPDLKINRTKKHLSGQVSLWPRLTEVRTQGNLHQLHKCLLYKLASSKITSITGSLWEMRIDNCKGCHIENAGKVTVPLNNYHIQVWLKTVITTDRSSSPCLLLEKQQHGLEWHVAHRAFTFVHKGSYGRKPSSMAHGGLEGGSTEGDGKMKPCHSCKQALILAGWGGFDRAFRNQNMWTWCEHLESSLFDVSHREESLAHVLTEHYNHIRLTQLCGLLRLHLRRWGLRTLMSYKTT